MFNSIKDILSQSSFYPGVLSDLVRNSRHLLPIYKESQSSFYPGVLSDFIIKSLPWLTMLVSIQFLSWGSF